MFQSNFVQDDAFQILRFFLIDLINRNFELSFKLHNQYETVVKLVQPAYASQTKRVEKDLIKTIKIKKEYLYLKCRKVWIMPADRFDIEDLEIGSTFQLDVTIKGPDGLVVDLTDYLVRSKARKKYEDANAAFTFTTTIATPATDGKITMFLDATTTAGLTKGRYVYDLEIEDTAGIVTKIIKGSILVTPEATK